MTHTDLKEAAMKATPGPWADGNEALFVGGSETAHGRPWTGTVFAGSSRDCLIALTWAPEAKKAADLARFIAIANPTRILSLIEKNERMREALAADNATLRLYMGELSAQEIRAVRAAFNWVLARAALKEKP